MSVKDSEFSYHCPKCGGDDVDVIDQEDIPNEITGRITHFTRTLMCNECNHQWSKKHKVKEPKEKEEELDYDADFEEEPNLEDEEEDQY